MQMETERKLTTAWDNQDQKKKRVNIWVRIWQESYVLFLPVQYAYSRCRLEKPPGGQSGFHDQTLNGSLLLCHWKDCLVDPNFGSLSVHLVCHFSAAQLVHGHFLKTLSFSRNPSRPTSPSRWGILSGFLLMFHQGQKLLIFSMMFKMPFPYFSPSLLRIPTLLPAIYIIASSSSGSFPCLHLVFMRGPSPPASPISTLLIRRKI